MPAALVVVIPLIALAIVDGWDSYRMAPRGRLALAFLWGIGAAGLVAGIDLAVLRGGWLSVAALGTAAPVLEETCKALLLLVLAHRGRIIFVFDGALYGFAALRGFTSLIEPMPGEQAVALLNSFLTPMVDILFEYGGMLDKFRGDGIMAVFGVPDQRPDDTLRAIKAAVAMQERIGTMAVPSAPGLRLQMGIGINTGLVVAGNIGAPQRYDFTVVGDAVNLAARFEGNAGPGQILITQSTYDLVAPYVEALPLGTLRVKGKVEWVPAYQVLRLRSPELPVDRGTAASTGQFPGETAASAAAANASVAHTSQFVPLLRTIRSFPDAGAS